MGGEHYFPPIDAAILHEFEQTFDPLAAAPFDGAALDAGIIGAGGGTKPT